MAVTVLQENFDSYADWTVAGGTAAAGYGRSGPGVALTGNGVLRYTIPAPSESTTVTVGVAWRISSLSVNQAILSFRSDAGATTHLTVVATTTGVLDVRRGTSGGTVLAASAAGAVTADTWYYIELQAKLHDTTGFVTLRVNGTTVASNPTCDTKNAGTKTVFDSVALANITGATTLHDDCYIITGTDGVFAGDQRYGTAIVDVIHEPFNTLTAWTATAGTPTIVAGRTGTAVQLDATDEISLAIPSGQRSEFLIIGFAVNTSTLPAGNTNFLAFRSGGTTWWAMTCRADGSLQVAGAATTPAATLAAATWSYIEARILVRGSLTGATAIRKNDVQVGTANGITIDTHTVDELRLAKIGPTTLIDDLYVITGTAADWEGDQAITAGAAVNVWNGTTFVDAPVKVWDGSAFVDAVAVKVWNGSAFVDAV